MQSDHDPIAAAFIYLVLGFVLLAGLFVFGMIALPFITVIAVAYFAYRAHSEKVRAQSDETERLALIEKGGVEFPAPDAFIDKVGAAYAGKLGDHLPCVPLITGLDRALTELYEQEGFHLPLPDAPRANTLDYFRWKDAVKQRADELAETSPSQMVDAAVQAISSFFQHVPPEAREPLQQIFAYAGGEAVKSSPEVPFLELLKHPGEAVEALAHPLMKRFPRFGEIYTRNGANASNFEKTGKFMLPSQMKASAEAIAEAYLKDTPLYDLLHVRVPFQVPERTRMEHTCIVAGSGWGKTQLLQAIIADDLEKDDPPSLVLLDSTGAMIERIQKLAVFSDRLRDRILIIDPAHSPSLNMFDVSTPRFEAYSSDQKEDVQTEVVGLFNYIFASEAYDLTAHMGLAFSYAIRLMLSREGSTINDLRQLLEEPAPKSPGFAHSKFAADIAKLDSDTQDFFSQHFFSNALVGARGAIARRLHNLVTVPAFRRMFTASANTLDLYTEMQKGTIILVNTNQQLLKDDAMVLFGRFVIAKVLSAALERAALPQEKRRPAYLIIDEAAPYFDPTFESLLTRVRQFRLGVVIAFQHLEQASEKLRSAIASSTSIKYAGGLGFSDRRWLAREMETTPEFIGAQRKDSASPPKWTQFAVYVRNYTEKAISLRMPFFRLENLPKMSDADHAAMLERNTARVSKISVPPPALTPIPEPAAQSHPQSDHGEPGEY